MLKPEEKINGFSCSFKSNGHDIYLHTLAGFAFLPDGLDPH
jgi:hypothetical protein